MSALYEFLSELPHFSNVACVVIAVTKNHISHRLLRVVFVTLAKIIDGPL